MSGGIDTSPEAVAAVLRRSRPSAPGPWITDVSTDHLLVVRTINGPAEAIIPEGSDPEENEARARAIAALPDLHATCEALAAQVEQLRAENEALRGVVLRTALDADDGARMVEQNADALALTQFRNMAADLHAVLAPEPGGGA